MKWIVTSWATEGEAMEYSTGEIKELKNSNTDIKKGAANEIENMWHYLGLNRMWSENRNSGERTDHLKTNKTGKVRFT